RLEYVFQTVDVTLDTVDLGGMPLDGSVRAGPYSWTWADAPVTFTVLEGREAALYGQHGGLSRYVYMAAERDTTYRVEALTGTVTSAPTPGAARVDFVFEPIEVEVDTVNQTGAHIAARVIVAHGEPWQDMPVTLGVADGGGLSVYGISFGGRIFSVPSVTVRKDTTHSLDIETGEVTSTPTLGTTRLEYVFQTVDVTLDTVDLNGVHIDGLVSLHDSPDVPAPTVFPALEGKYASSHGSYEGAYRYSYFVINAGTTYSVDVPTGAVTSEATPGTTRIQFVFPLVINRPPTADAGEDQTAEQTTAAGAEVTLDGSGSSDPDDDPLTYTWKEGDTVLYGPTTDAQALVVLPLGSHAVTLIVEDEYGEADTDEVTVVVVDTTSPSLSPPPDVTVEEASPGGTPVDLGMPTVSDLCDPAPAVENDAPALFDVGPTTVTWMATDYSGNVATAQQRVEVIPGSPENQLDNMKELIADAVLSGDLSSELEGSLLAKVDAALDALAGGNKNDAKTAMNQLKALINEVEAQTGKKIDPGVAAEIIERANRLIADLGE
ncbi:PKD domain-containing protein, partial [Planctomycetota bacterium]